MYALGRWLIDQKLIPSKPLPPAWQGRDENEMRYNIAARLVEVESVMRDKFDVSFTRWRDDYHNRVNSITFNKPEEYTYCMICISKFMAKDLDEEHELNTRVIY